jgi:endonuclease/exonuclease/phosphatase family metal-dependent hydrolase
MRRIRSIRTVGLLIVLLLANFAWAADEPKHKDGLRVMSFNIRYGTAADGENSWTKRRDFMIEVIRKFDPDLLGTQEVLAHQADFLTEQLSGYTLIGVGREDGKRKGEFSSVMFKTDRFEPVESGTFWLSEKPDEVGSKSWDSSLPRIVTWVKLRDKSAGGRELLWLNTHWDHRGNKARIESGKIMRKWIDEHAGDLPVVVTGDLNVNEDHEGLMTLLDHEAKPPLLDTYRAVRSQRRKDEATAHAFTGNKNGRRIDFILCSQELAPTAAEIVRTNREGKYPSDHFPVTAELTLKPKMP